MPQPQVIINQAGPLPIHATVTTGSVGPATLVVAGSVWSQTADREIGINVVFDGQSVGKAVIFSNDPAQHRAVVPSHIPITLDKPFTGDPPTDPPSYTVELVASTGDTVSDQNDWFQVVLLA